MQLADAGCDILLLLLLENLEGALRPFGYIFATTTNRKYFLALLSFGACKVNSVCYNNVIIISVRKVDIKDPVHLLKPSRRKIPL